MVVMQIQSGPSPDEELALQNDIFMYVTFVEILCSSRVAVRAPQASEIIVTPISSQTIFGDETQ